MIKHQAFINGNLYDNNEWYDIISPIDLQPAGSVPALKAEDIAFAFKSARASQKCWAQTPLFERIKKVQLLEQLLVQKRDQLAHLITTETAKTLQAALSEVDRTCKYIAYSIEEAKRLNPETYLGEGFNVQNKIGIFKRVPRGVILAIAPFNYPVNLSISKIVPSLLAGNTVVFKPPTNGSLCGTFLAQLFHKCAFPQGVINVVTGRGRDIGDLLITNPEIDLISFTGSVATGQRIRKLADGKPLVLELGGKDPMLVLRDANMQKVAQDIVAGGLAFSGQRCTAIKLVLVHQDDVATVLQHLKPLVAQLKVGNPLEKAFITPLVTQQAADYAYQLAQAALDQGAELVYGHQKTANLLHPTIINKVTKKMALGKEEPFAPIIPIMHYTDQTEMINLANDSEYGLQASIYTQDINQAFKIADKLEVGTVNINGKSQRGPDSFPFLGVKNSGQGVQGIKDTFLSVTRPKGTVINY